MSAKPYYATGNVGSDRRSLQLLRAEVRAIRPMSPEELAAQWFELGPDGVVNALVPYARYIGSAKHPPYLDEAEAISTALLTLVTTIYNLFERGVVPPRVFSYVKTAIKRAMLQREATDKQLVALEYSVGYRIRAAENELRAALRREPTVEEIATAAKAQVETVRSWIATDTIPALRLSDPIRNEHGLPTHETVDATIEQSSSEWDGFHSDPAAYLDRVDDQRTVARLMQGAKPALTDTERAVLRLKFGIVDGVEYTHAEIAYILNISIANARKTSHKAIAKIRRGLSEPQVKNALDSAIWKIKQGIKVRGVS